MAIVSPLPLPRRRRSDLIELVRLLDLRRRVGSGGGPSATHRAYHESRVGQLLGEQPRGSR